MEYYEYSSKSGDSSALFLLAQLYYFGTDASGPNLERALYFFEEAAKAGNDTAYGFLGMMYYRGEGVEVDVDRAKLYFSIASEKNVAVAINGLGLLYWHGHGVEKDIYTAEILFKRASDLKYAEAYYNHAMVLIEQSSLFSTEQVFQDILAASKAGTMILMNQKLNI
jgi:TPR repeat protein